MQVKAINRRAVARYGRFWASLVLVGECLAQAQKVAGELGDLEGNKRGLAVASGEDVRASVKKADRALLVLSRSAKRWEAELKSREWRV